MVAFLSLFCLLAHQLYDAGTNTYPRLCTPFLFCKIDTGTMPTSTRRSRASALQIIWTLSENCPMVTFASDTFFSSTHFDLVSLMARKVRRHCVLVFVQHFGYRDGNCIGLLANTGLFLSTGNRYLFLLQSRLIPSRCLTTAPVSIFRAWRQSFVIVISNLYSSSPWSSTFDYWASIPSDESPCRTILMRF